METLQTALTKKTSCLFLYVHTSLGTNPGLKMLGQRSHIWMLSKEVKASCTVYTVDYPPLGSNGLKK